MLYSNNDISKALELSYTWLRQCLDSAHESVKAENDAARKLTDRKASIITDHADDPKALGSNEAARAATLDAMCYPEREALRGAQDTLVDHRHALELARHEVELWRAQLRCLEAGAGTAHLG